MGEEYLTLSECFEQPGGTVGRLFEVSIEGDVSTLIFDREIIGAYQVVERNGEAMKIEAYLLGGCARVFENIPLNKHLQDLTLSSGKLLRFYTQPGQELVAQQSRLVPK